MQEKRGFVRLDVDAHMMYKIKGKNDSACRMSLEDVSSNGVRVISNKLLQNSDLLELTLEIPGIDGVIRAQGRVAWQRQVTMDLLDTGIEFTQINDIDKKKLVDFIEGSTGRDVERREYVRCPLNTGVRYLVVSDPEVERDCVSVDVCVLGLKIMAKEKLEKGTQLRIMFSLPDEKDQIVAKCTVVAWVKQGGENFFETGIEFLEISAENKDRINRYIQKTLGEGK